MIIYSLTQLSNRIFNEKLLINNQIKVNKLEPFTNMCLSIISWLSHEKYPLIVISNRDEFSTDKPFS